MNDKEEAKKQYEEYKKWESSLEGILYNLGTIGVVTEEDEKDEILIAKTLQKLPKDIRERVLEEALFVLTSGYGTLHELYFPVPPKTKEIRQPLIILNFALMRNEGKTEDDLMDTVAHEIGHHILGHHRLHNDPAGERKADDLAEKWGFKRAYYNYEQFERLAKLNK